MALLPSKSRPQFQHLAPNGAACSPVNSLPKFYSRSSRLQATILPDFNAYYSFLPLDGDIHVATTQGGAVHVPCLPFFGTECSRFASHTAPGLRPHYSKAISKPADLRCQ